LHSNLQLHARAESAEKAGEEGTAKAKATAKLQSHTLYKSLDISLYRRRFPEHELSTLGKKRT
jgi:hypothetical protein